MVKTDRSTQWQFNMPLYDLLLDNIHEYISEYSGIFKSFVSWANAQQKNLAEYMLFINSAKLKYSKSYKFPI